MIILDIDGVVANPFNELNLMLEESNYKVDSWDKWDNQKLKLNYPNVSNEVLDSCLVDPLMYKNAIAFEDTWYWVNHYSSIYDMMFLTSRDKSLTDVTWSWFLEWDIPADFIVFEDKKIEFLTLIEPTVYIDDNADTVLESRYAGVNSYLLNRPYNKTANVNKEFRIDSLWEIDCV